jgi:8-oxo-dGTP pyrophosphatase MutT (NUDIX family)
MGEKIECDCDKAHYVVATAIIVKNNKFLIAKRADWEKNMPGKWTVPGGKLETSDYTKREYDTKEGKQWYNIVEILIRREVKEEVGMDIKEIGYVCSLAYIRHDSIPCLIISLYAYPASEEIKLCSALSEYAWVSLDEAKNYDLIDGIYHELEILDNFLKTGKNMIWKKN